MLNVRPGAVASPSTQIRTEARKMCRSADTLAPKAAYGEVQAGRVPSLSESDRAPRPRAAPLLSYVWRGPRSAIRLRGTVFEYPLLGPSRSGGSRPPFGLASVEAGSTGLRVPLPARVLRVGQACPRRPNPPPGSRLAGHGRSLARDGRSTRRVRACASPWPRSVGSVCPGPPRGSSGARTRGRPARS